MCLPVSTSFTHNKRWTSTEWSTSYGTHQVGLLTHLYSFLSVFSRTNIVATDNYNCLYFLDDIPFTQTFFLWSKNAPVLCVEWCHVRSVHLKYEKNPYLLQSLLMIQEQKGIEAHYCAQSHYGLSFLIHFISFFQDCVCDIPSTYINDSNFYEYLGHP